MVAMKSQRVAAIVVVVAATLGAQPSAQAPGANGAAASRSLRIAVVQMGSVDHDLDANLRRATGFAEQAVARGAQFVLFPEMMATGSYLAADSWDSAEPSNGKSVQWLAATSRRLHVWIATTFLEASGTDFYDTFVLTGPTGEEAGRVRKQITAGAEGYFFRGDTGSHVISTAIGKIGVGICAENYYCFAASQFLNDSVDFVVMPHATPDMSKSGGLSTPPGTHLTLWYARKLGVPVALVNKVGPSYKPPPNEIDGVFRGESAIVDSDATVLQSMDDKEGVGIATIRLDAARKTRAPQVCTGIGIAELAVGGAEGVKAVGDANARAQKSYETNLIRKMKARAISGDRPR